MVISYELWHKKYFLLEKFGMSNRTARCFGQGGSSKSPHNNSRTLANYDSFQARSFLTHLALSEGIIALVILANTIGVIDGGIGIRWANNDCGTLRPSSDEKTRRSKSKWYKEAVGRQRKSFGIEKDWLEVVRQEHQCQVACTVLE